MNRNKLFITAVLLHAPLAVTFGQDANSRAEARQLMEETTPQAKARLAKREAQAAYEEAIAECKKLRGADRSACVQQAKTQLQSDLAEAQKNLTTGQ